MYLIKSGLTLPHVIYYISSDMTRLRKYQATVIGPHNFIHTRCAVHNT